MSLQYQKKVDLSRAKNYRLVSVLSSVSKIFERILQRQVSSYADQFLSTVMCGYRKVFSTQQALLSLIERSRYTLDQNGYGCTKLMDLSKAFDTINHDLLIDKLGAYGFDIASLKLIRSCLTNRFQRTKVNTSFSIWSKLLLGPLLSNIHINDLFYLSERLMYVIMLTIQLSMLVTWILKIVLLGRNIMRPLL